MSVPAVQVNEQFSSQNAHSAVHKPGLVIPSTSPLLQGGEAGNQNVAGGGRGYNGQGGGAGYGGRGMRYQSTGMPPVTAGGRGGGRGAQ